MKMTIHEFKIFPIPETDNQDMYVYKLFNNTDLSL